MSKEQQNLVVGLDIGTSKIVAIVAELMPEGDLKVIGLGQHESRGLKRGVVINIDSYQMLNQQILYRRMMLVVYTVIIRLV